MDYTNRVDNTPAAMQILMPLAFYCLGSYCMHRTNISLKQVIKASALNAMNISNLNRLRTTTCCIGISATLQFISGRSRLSKGHRTDINLVLDAVSVASFGYLIVTGKIHFLFAFVILGMQMVISNIYIQKQISQQSSDHQTSQQSSDHQTSQQSSDHQTSQQRRDHQTSQQSLDHQRESLLQPLEGRLQQMIDEAQDICKQPIVNESDINECIESCECLLKDLNERDRVEKEGFNPMNEVASKLKFFWKALIQELPRNLRYDHTINESVYLKSDL